MDCVIDLSFSAGWFHPSQSQPDAVRLLRSHLAGEANLICPALWNYEVLNLLATATRRGTLTEAQADAGLELLNALDVRTEELAADTLRRRVHRFARQFKLTAYDAAYLELADRLQAPLLTRDADLITAAKQRNLPVTLPS